MMLPGYKIQVGDWIQYGRPIRKYIDGKWVATGPQEWFQIEDVTQSRFDVLTTIVVDGKDVVLRLSDEGVYQVRR